MVLCIKFGMSLAVSLLAVSHTSLGGQMACWLVLIILAARVRGRAVLSPWLAEGEGRKTRARIDMRDGNILWVIVLHFDAYISWKLLSWQVSTFYLSSVPSPHISGALRTVRVYEIHLFLMLYIWNNEDLSPGAQLPRETSYTLGDNSHKPHPLVPNGRATPTANWPPSAI